MLHGVASIAAPIDDHRNVSIGAMAISGPAKRLCEDHLPRAELVGQVMEAARAVSRELGAFP
jgi:DNA-binding IclR family transcriptional regulator